MPEQITKHPDVTQQVLESAGAQCAAGIQPEILTQCPVEQFCKLPGGEVCIYGIDQIPDMTQITAADLAPVVCRDAGTAPASAALGGEALLLAGVFAVGLAAGRWRRR